MNKVLNLLEYDQVRFEEAQDENKEGLYDGRLLITRETLDQLEEVNKPQKFLEIYRNKIKALNYVGVVKAGSITIEILPKFISSKDKAFEGTDKNTESIIMGNLLKMLYFTGRLKFKEVDTAELRRVDDCDFFEVFVYLFAKNLVNLLKFKQDKKYLRKYEELRFVKGRIDTSRYCANPAK
ncbi:MAG: 5-methylcytosine restriction system specificity protein McrC, partial [Promethearchaeota archaeon]